MGQRTGWPAAARADLTSPIETVPKWKTLAARTASAPASTAGGKWCGRAGAAGGDDRDGDLRPDQPDQGQVEAFASPVGVHGVEQDLAGAELGAPHGPLERVETGGLAAAVGRHLETGRGARGTARVDGEHQHLVAEPVRDLGDQLGPVEGGGVDGDLVGPRAQQAVDVVDRGHAAADGQAG